VILTKNDRDVLKTLLDNGRYTDSEIACEIKITPQAVGKIRHKLEKNGVIKGYKCKIDYEKIGINVLGIALLRMKNEFWHNIKKENFYKFFKDIPASTYTCIPISSNITAISIYGFRDLKEMDKYTYLAKTQLMGLGEVVKIYPFSVGNVIKDDDSKLINLILDEKKNVPVTIDKFVKK